MIFLVWPWEANLQDETWSRPFAFLSTLITHVLSLVLLVAVTQRYKSLAMRLCLLFFHQMPSVKSALRAVMVASIADKDRETMRER